jgi:hypothetical protein
VPGIDCVTSMSQTDSVLVRNHHQHCHYQSGSDGSGDGVALWPMRMRSRIGELAHWSVMS